jgi:TatD DNase family protein
MRENHFVTEVGLVDSHCHLDLEQFDADRDAVIERARAAGVRLIVNPGIDLDRCRRALALCDRYPEMRVAVGVHPNSSDGFDAAAVSELRRLAAHPKVVAIGEIGLDYYWKIVAPEQQQLAFQAQLELAADLGLPVIIHCRQANEDVAAVLRVWVQSEGLRRSALAARESYGVLHAFPGDWALAQEAYEWRFVIGLGGPITYKKAHLLHALLPHLRLDRLMLETDAPYLTPHPHRGQRNEPSYVALICAEIARLLGCSAQHVAVQTSAVAQRFFAGRIDVTKDLLCAESPVETHACA